MGQGGGAAVGIHCHHFKNAFEHFFVGRVQGLRQTGDTYRERAAAHAADPGAQREHVAHGHGRQKTHVRHARHHHVALGGAACGHKGSLGHELERVAAKKCSVVVGVLGKDDFREFGGTGGACHDSQFTQNTVPA
ncbi:hypothetical protein D3C71_1857540 [compost metagenome]